MSIQPAAGDQNDPSVPALQIVTQLEPVSVRAPTGAGRVGFRLRMVLAACLIVAAGAASAMVAIQRVHPAQARAQGLGGVAGIAALPRSRPVPVATGADAAIAESGGRLVVPGVGQEQRTGADATQRTAARRPAAPSTHYLTADDLINLADGSSVYQPAPYLSTIYRRLAARDGIPWPLLAAVEYIGGGYTNAVAGATAPATEAAAAQVGADGQRAIGAAVLGHAIAAASAPSRTLVAAVHQLVADGAAQNPAHALATFLQTSPATPQQVLTLAQAIGSAHVGSSSPPAVKVRTMLDEAKLLNGLPYVWGGGHTNPAWVVGSGYDCSGFVSEVLHAAGYLTSPDTTQTLPGTPGIVSGPGRYVTLYDRTIATEKVWVRKRKTVTIRKAVNPSTIGVHVDRNSPIVGSDTVSIRLPKWVGQWETIRITKLVRSRDNSNNDEHVIIDIDGQWWESGGSTADGGAAMVHRITDPSRAYLKSFNRILHPAGL